MIQSGDFPRAQAAFWPRTASRFEVERQVDVDGINVDIRHFGWDRCFDAEFETSFYYLDLSLKPRASDSRIIEGPQRRTPMGDMMFLPNGSAFKVETGASDHSVLCMTFGIERALRLLQNDRLSELPPCLDLRAAPIRQAMVRLLEEVRNPGFCSDVLIEGITLTLVVELCRHLGEAFDAKSAMTGKIADWRLNRIRERIHDGLSGALTIEALAADCRMSPRHLIRTFKNTVGITLSSYIADTRLARAKEQLLDPDLRIKVIAGQCGFQSAAAFTAAFRRGTGSTPREYRDEMLHRGH
jgi:AraC family transcriptional regulator